MTQILLMRGLNESASEDLSMSDLHSLLLVLGAGSMVSLMKNGNVVCAHDVDAHELAHSVQTACGLFPMIIALSRDAWHERVSDNPFDGAPPKCVQAFFRGSDEVVDTGEMETYAGRGEDIIATPGMIWLYAEKGAAKSKLIQRIDDLSDTPLIIRSLHMLNQINRHVGDPV